MPDVDEKLDQLQSVQLMQSVKLDRIVEILEKLQAQNEILRNEIFELKSGEFTGNKIPANEVAEKPQVGAPLCSKIKEEKEINLVKIKREEADSNDLGKDQFVDTRGYRPVKIRSKTIFDEREWMRENFNDFKLMQKQIVEGPTLWGTTIDNFAIQSRFNERLRKGCAVSIFNFLPTCLTKIFKKKKGQTFSDDYDSTRAISVSLPTRILPGECDIAYFGGDTPGEMYFDFSYGINPGLRFGTYCIYKGYGGDFKLSIGFMPVDQKTDGSLDQQVKSMMPDSDFIKDYSDHAIVLYANYGEYYAKVHMTPGPWSKMTVEILQVNTSKEAEAELASMYLHEMNSRQCSSDFSPLKQNIPGSGMETAVCVVEIVNSLGDALKSSQHFIRMGKLNKISPSDVPPLAREVFIASDLKAVEIILSYEIETTDIRIILALSTVPKNNYFAAMFQSTCETGILDDVAFNKCMNATLGGFHKYRRCVCATEGEEVIETRNIRARVSMTNEKRSHLQIHLYAV